jgi:hypothetical protein
MTKKKPDELTDTGGLPRQTEAINQFLTALNEKFADPNKKGDVAAILTDFGEDLSGALHALTNQDVPAHVAEYVAHAKPYHPILFGAMRCFSEGKAKTVQLAHTTSVDGAPEFAIAMNGNDLVITIHALPA